MALGRLARSLPEETIAQIAVEQSTVVAIRAESQLHACHERAPGCAGSRLRARQQSSLRALQLAGELLFTIQRHAMGTWLGRDQAPCQATTALTEYAAVRSIPDHQSTIRC